MPQASRPGATPEACSSSDGQPNQPLTSTTTWVGTDAVTHHPPLPSLAPNNSIDEAMPLLHRTVEVGAVAAGEAILLIGETQGWLGQSLYLRDICGREEGAPPPVDLMEERENGELVRKLDERRAKTLVLMISACDLDCLRELEKTKIKITFLQKPFGVERFWRVIESLLGPCDNPPKIPDCLK